MKKLRNNSGETIVETLAAVLIVALCFLMLAGAIVTSSKINKQAKEQITPFKVSSKSSSSANIKINGQSVDSKDYKLYESGGYYYYE